MHINTVPCLYEQYVYNVQMKSASLVTLQYCSLVVTYSSPHNTNQTCMFFIGLEVFNYVNLDQGNSLQACRTMIVDALSKIVLLVTSA